MINSRRLEDLHPKVMQMASEFVKEAKKELGIDILVTSTHRDNESQNALYALGRTAKGANPKPSKPMGDIVTNAKGGQSFHNYKVALDFAPLVNGKPAWNDTALFTKCGELAEKHGFEWAGRWKKFKELAHIQYTNGLTLADFQAGKTI
jgi:peptidoglycan L-alanyl-D-glutamate endopeptidase CwlK